MKVLKLQKNNKEVEEEEDEEDDMVVKDKVHQKGRDLLLQEERVMLKEGKTYNLL
ncbi:hypothetical protein ACFLY2_03100 [Patescibacteria group bacterium]